MSLKNNEAEKKGNKIDEILISLYQKVKIFGLFDN